MNRAVYDRLMTAIGRPDMGLSNPAHATDAARCESQDVICGAIADWVAEHSSEEVMTAMAAARVPAGPILTIADIAHEEQYQARNMFQPATPPGGVAAGRAGRDGLSGSGTVGINQPGRVDQ